MQKKNLILASFLVFTLLLFGVYVYADELSQNNPGHSWDEMDCDSQMCVTSSEVAVGREPTSSDNIETKISDRGVRFTRSSDGATAAGVLFNPDTQNINLSAWGGAGNLSLSTNTANALFINSSGNVGIGTTNPSYKLHVTGDIYANGGWLRTSGQAGWYSQSYGGGWYMTDTTWVRAYNSKPVYSPGEIRSGTKLSAVRGSADSATMELYSDGASRMSLNTGRYGNEAIISTPNNSLYMYIGGKSLVIRGPGGSTDNTANVQVDTVYSTQTKVNNGKLISGTRSNFLLSLQSDRNMVLYDNGSPVWWSGTNVSDIRLKKNITKVDNVLDDLLKLDAVRFNWIEKLNWGDKKEIGLIAQEVEKDFPELVYTDKNGYKLIDYEKITPLLLAGMKEQQGEIENQQEEIEVLKKRLERLENGSLEINKSSTLWGRLFGK